MVLGGPRVPRSWLGSGWGVERREKWEEKASGVWSLPTDAQTSKVWSNGPFSTKPLQRPMAAGITQGALVGTQLQICMRAYCALVAFSVEEWLAHHERFAS